jgi:hypothetical protein
MKSRYLISLGLENISKKKKKKSRIEIILF